MRLHESKSVFTVYDLVDDFSVRGGSGPFIKQYKHRCNLSYNTEEFPIVEREIQFN